MAEAVRDGKGPRFLENRTYRFRAHSMFDPELYREKAEVETWKRQCPIEQFTAWLMQIRAIHDSDVAAIEKTVAATIEEAVSFSETAPWEPVEDLLKDVYTPQSLAASGG